MRKFVRFLAVIAAIAGSTAQARDTILLGSRESNLPLVAAQVERTLNIQLMLRDSDHSDPYYAYADSDGEIEVRVYSNFDTTEKMFNHHEARHFATIINLSGTSNRIEEMRRLFQGNPMIRVLKEPKLPRVSPIKPVRPQAPRTLINVIDLEATCWKQVPGQTKGEDQGDQLSDIIEIGITVLDYTTLEIVSTESILVKPERSKVSEFCTELTTLTQEEIEAKGKSFPDAIKHLKKYYAPKNRLFASFGDYDRRKFEEMFNVHKLPSCFGNKHLNVKSLFAVTFGLWREVGMDVALESLGIPLEGTHHRGSDDSKNIAKILAKLLRGMRSSIALQLPDPSLAKTLTFQGENDGAGPTHDIGADKVDSSEETQIEASNGTLW